MNYQRIRIQQEATDPDQQQCSNRQGMVQLLVQLISGTVTLRGFYQDAGIGGENNGLILIPCQGR
jgi:hypothetical protein